MHQFLTKIVPAYFKIPDDSLPLVKQFEFLTDQCLPGTLGMKMEKLEKEESIATITTGQHNVGIHGLMHGGTTFSVGDTMTAMMTVLNGNENTKNILTVNASIRYLRVIENETITCKSRLKKRQDNKLHFVSDFYNEKGKRVAQGKYTYLLV